MIREEHIEEGRRSRHASGPKKEEEIHMKKGIRKFLAVSLAAMMALALTACSGSGETTAQTTAETTGAAESGETTADSGSEAKSAEGLKVGLILSGPISDMSWNYTAYQGLMKIEEQGAEVFYQENVQTADAPDQFRTYSTAGVDLVFVSSDSYQDITLEAAPDYPDMQFIIINGSVNEGNVCSVQVSDEEQGFMMGVIAATASQSGSVGFVGGQEITPIINGSKGFEQGAKYANDSIQVTTTMTGSMTDTAAAKEQSIALADAGCDVVVPMADNASLGVLEGAEDQGIHSVGTGEGQESSGPNSMLIAVNKDTAVAYLAAFEQYLNNELPTDSTVPKYGVAEGVVSLGDWQACADEVLTDEQKQSVEDIYQQLVNGEIEISLD